MLLLARLVALGRVEQANVLIEAPIAAPICRQAILATVGQVGGGVFGLVELVS